MSTTFRSSSPGSSRARPVRTCATISSAPMWRFSPATPLAQKTQPIAQPICVEMHCVTRTRGAIGAHPSPSRVAISRLVVRRPPGAQSRRRRRHHRRRPRRPRRRPRAATASRSCPPSPTESAPSRWSPRRRAHTGASAFGRPTRARGRPATAAPGPQRARPGAPWADRSSRPARRRRGHKSSGKSGAHGRADRRAPRPPAPTPPRSRASGGTAAPVDVGAAHGTRTLRPRPPSRKRPSENAAVCLRTLPPRSAVAGLPSGGGGGTAPPYALPARSKAFASSQ